MKTPAAYCGIPRALDVSAYAAARLRELWRLQHVVRAEQWPNVSRNRARAGRSTRRVFQLLPWHARRRTMSFSTHRVPRPFRHLAWVELSKQPAASRRSRRSKLTKKEHYRRRRWTRRAYRKSAFLVRDRSEVTSPYGWLETHVWHAKRMHMFEPCWGGRLAWAPCDRGLRSFWRCVSRGQSDKRWRLCNDICAIYDASWYRVIEIPEYVARHVLPGLVGERTWARLCCQPVWLGLKRLENTAIWDESGRMIAAQVEWLWEPPSLPVSSESRREPAPEGTQPMEIEQTASNESGHLAGHSKRRLWAMVHPLVKDAVLELLQRGVSRMLASSRHEAAPAEVYATTLDEPLVSGTRPKRQEGTSALRCAAQMERSPDAQEHTSTWSNTPDTVQELPDGLVRFELYGKRSTEALHRALLNANAQGRDWIAFSQLASRLVSADSVSGQSVFHLHCADPRLFYPPRVRVPGQSLSQTQADYNYDAFGTYLRAASDWKRNSSLPAAMHARTLFDTTWRNELVLNGVRALPERSSTRILRWKRRLARAEAALQATHSRRPVAGTCAAVVPRTSSTAPPLKKRRVEPAPAGTLSSSAALEASRVLAGEALSGLAAAQAGEHSTLLRIPVVLLHRPAQARRRWDSGWDVLLPKRWAMPFWSSLCYAGARGVGLRERRYVYHESGRCHFPEDFPECREAYTRWAQRDIERAAEQWKRRPPSKRVNFTLYRVPEPFGVADWLTTSLSSAGNAAGAGTAAVAGEELHVLRSRKALIAHDPYQTASHSEQHSVSRARYLVRVRLHPIGRAPLETNALICLPHTEDLGLDASTSHARVDAVQEQRPVPVIEEPRGTHNDHQSTRQVIGRLTCSQYSWSDGCVRAYGFVDVDTLNVCAGFGSASQRRAEHPVVLVRNVTSRVYRWARLEPLFDEDT
jgi:hypothetical protein